MLPAHGPEPARVALIDLPHSIPVLIRCTAQDWRRQQAAGGLDDNSLVHGHAERPLSRLYAVQGWSQQLF